MYFPMGKTGRHCSEMALAALAKHWFRLGMQTANTQPNKLTKHTYQFHMFRAACPVSLENL